MVNRLAHSLNLGRLRSKVVLLPFNPELGWARLLYCLSGNYILPVNMPQRRGTEYSDPSYTLGRRCINVRNEMNKFTPQMLWSLVNEDK